MRPPIADDGRNIDASRGALRGEGATLGLDVPDRAYPGSRALWPRPPSEPARSAESPTYYDQPVIKAPVWIWSIAAYLFVGGAAGASAALGSAAQAIDPRGLRGLILRAHAVSAIGDVLSAGLLIHDLGRPARFLNMLRVFRPTSPMSMGSWILTGSGAASTLALILWPQRGALGRIGNLAGYVSGALGLALAGYTGVLLASTAVPVWLGGRRTLPALFLASGATSAGTILGLLPLRRREREVARRFAIMGGAAELVLGLVYEREVGRSERAARPLHEGVSGALWKLSRGLTAAGLGLALLGNRRRVSRLANLLGAGGALALRVAVFTAGKASARDPRATFEQQRVGV